MLFDDIAIVNSGAYDLTDSANDALKRLFDLYQSYCEIRPTNDKWPLWANWYYVDANGDGWWSEYKPEIIIVSGDTMQWVSRNGCLKYDIRVAGLEKGIDWRLCLWPKEQ